MKIQLTTSELKPDDTPGEFKEQILTLNVTANHHTIDRLVSAISNALDNDNRQAAKIPNNPIYRDDNKKGTLC